MKKQIEQGIRREPKVELCAPPVRVGMEPQLRRSRGGMPRRGRGGLRTRMGQMALLRRLAAAIRRRQGLNPMLNWSERGGD